MNKSKRIVVTLTEKCNFDCSYCNHLKRDLSIDEEITSKLIDQINQSNQDIEIQFCGGEPLIEFEIIKDIVSKIKQPAKYLITTNGSLITEEIALFFKENNFKVSVSLDGSKSDHDINRVTKNKLETYNKVKEGIRILKENHLKLSSEMVITPKTSENIVNNLRSLIKEGISEVFIMPVCGIEWTNDDLNKLNKSINQLKEEKHNLSEITISNFNSSNDCTKFNTEITLNCDGNIYSGNAYLMNTDLETTTILGNIKQDSIFNLNQIKEKTVSKKIYSKDIVSSFKQAGEIINSLSKMKYEEKVSVQIASYRPNYLKNAILSTINQDSSEWELVILVDGPPKEKLEQIKEILKEFSQDSRIKVHYQDNQGEAITRKKLYKMTNCRYILPLDDDDMLCNNAVSEVLKCFKENPGASIVKGGNHTIPVDTNFGDYITIPSYFKPIERKIENGMTTNITFVDQLWCFNKELYDQMEEVKLLPGSRQSGVEIELFLKMEEVGPICWIPKVLYLRKEWEEQATKQDNFLHHLSDYCIAASEEAIKRRNLDVKVIYDFELRVFKKPRENNVFSINKEINNIWICLIEGELLKSEGVWINTIKLVNDNQAVNIYSNLKNLNLDLIEKITNHCKENNKKPNIIIDTNPSEEQIKQLSEIKYHNLTIIIKHSYNIKNILHQINSSFNKKINLEILLNHQTLTELNIEPKLVFNEKIKSIKLNIEPTSQWRKEDLIILKKEYIKLLNNLNSAISSDHAPQFSPLIRTFNIDKNNEKCPFYEKIKVFPSGDINTNINRSTENLGNILTGFKDELLNCKWKGPTCRECLNKNIDRATNTSSIGSSLAKDIIFNSKIIKSFSKHIENASKNNPTVLNYLKEIKRGEGFE